MKRFLAVFAMTLFLTACYKTESSLTDTLVYCTQTAPQSFNPQFDHDVSTLDATTHQLYNRLIKIDPFRKQFIPELATHWQRSDDKLSYLFYLRKGVQFHQTDYFQATRPFNADDVIFSLQRILNEDHPFHFVNHNNDKNITNHALKNLVDDVVKIDDYTIKIILKKTDVSLLAALAAHYSVIHSQEYADSLSATAQQEIDFLPIGTGPFKFKNYQEGAVIRYLAHDKYWNSAPAIEHLIYDITPNDSKRYAKLLTGECDVMTYPAPSQLKAMKRKQNVHLNSKPTANIAFLAFNSVSEAVAQREIRQALSLAINQQTIIDAVFFENATATNTLLAKQSWAYNPHSQQLDYQPLRALKLLKQNDFDFTKKLTILTPIEQQVYNPNFHKTAELIQNDLSEIGVRSEIISLPQTELNLRLASGDYDTYLSGVNVHMHDPDSLFRPLFSCNSSIIEGNSSKWCNLKVENLLDSARTEINQTKRIENYRQLQNIIQNERLYFPIAHELRTDAFNHNISGIKVNPLTGIDFQHVLKLEAL